MKSSFALALLWSTALVAAAGAQTPPPTTADRPLPQAQGSTMPTRDRAAPTAADCDRLMTMVEQRQEKSASITPDAVRIYRRDANFKACRDGLNRLEGSASSQPAGSGQASADGSQITIQQSAPDISVQQAPPEITVRQARPSVTVQQKRPQILVRQPAATVTVDIPQPEITVRMPEPDVDVALARPEVTVNQPQPRVQVTRTDMQPEVNLQRQAGAEAQVQVQPATQQPQVHFERAEPRVVVNQQGQPQVRFERMTDADRAAAPTSESSDKQASATTGTSPARQPIAGTEVSAVGAPTAGRAAPAGAAQPDTRIAAATAPAAVATTMLAVSKLTDYDLFNARGEQLGDVERVVQGADGRPKIVIGHGGFLGLGEKRVAVPVENVWISGERLVVRGLTDEQIKSMPAWSQSAGERQLGDSQRIPVENRS